MPAQSKLISSLVAFCVLSNYQAFGDRSISQISALQLSRAQPDTRIGNRARALRFVKNIFGGGAAPQDAPAEIQPSAGNARANPIQDLVEKYEAYSHIYLNSVKDAHESLNEIAPKMLHGKTSSEIYTDIFGDFGQLSAGDERSQSKASELQSKAQSKERANVFRTVKSVAEGYPELFEHSTRESFQAASIVLMKVVNMYMSEKEYLGFVMSLQDSIRNNSSFPKHLRSWFRNLENKLRSRSIDPARSIDLAQEVLHVCLFHLMNFDDSNRMAAAALLREQEQAEAALLRRQERSPEQIINDAIINLTDHHDHAERGQVADIKRLIAQQRAVVEVEELKQALKDAGYMQTTGKHEDVQSEEDNFTVEVSVLADVINKYLTSGQYEIFLHLVRNRDRFYADRDHFFVGAIRYPVFIGGRSDEAGVSLLDMMLRRVKDCVVWSDALLHTDHVKEGF